MSILDKVATEVKSWFEPNVTVQQKAQYLDSKAATTGGNLDWRNSVVDLLKLMGQDSSLSARAALAKELGYQGPFTGSAAENEWLHGKLMDNLKIR
jgi:hypothetical protein